MCASPHCGRGKVQGDAASILRTGDAAAVCGAFRPGANDVTMAREDSDELDILDAMLARFEGPPTYGISAQGRAVYADRSPYQPTRNPEELLRLINLYIARLIRMDDGSWAAIGPAGRATVAPSLPVAVCRAVLEFR